MKQVLSRTILPALLLLSLAASASNQPIDTTAKSQLFLTASSVKKEASPKICACQILQVNSSNENIARLAVFAEKRSNGELEYEQKIAKSVLDKEKKNMKLLFYPKMKLIQSITSFTDCQTLYKQLQLLNDGVKMYEIVDADIRSGVQ